MKATLTAILVAGACVLAFGLLWVPVASALSGPLGSVSTPAVTCGGAAVVLDGGASAGFDGGPLVVDGGYPVVALGGGRQCFRVSVQNTGGATVYLGGPDVQPSAGYPVCKTTVDAGTCASQELIAEIQCGAMHCTATTAVGRAQGLNVMLEGP